MHGGPALAPFDEDDELADEVSEGMHHLWWKVAQRVASETAVDPSGTAHRRPFFLRHHCVECVARCGSERVCRCNM